MRLFVEACFSTLFLGAIFANVETNQFDNMFWMTAILKLFRTKENLVFQGLLRYFQNSLHLIRPPFWNKADFIKSICATELILMVFCRFANIELATVQQCRKALKLWKFILITLGRFSIFSYLYVTKATTNFWMVHYTKFRRAPKRSFQRLLPPPFPLDNGLSCESLVRFCLV